VLQVAPAAPVGPGERARRRHPVRGRVQDLDRVGPQEALALLGHQRPDPLARQRVADEDDAPVHPGDAVSTVGDRPHLQFEDRLLQPFRHEGHRRLDAFFRRLAGAGRGWAPSPPPSRGALPGTVSRVLRGPRGGRRVSASS
jgi:hypothetical protein